MVYHCHAARSCLFPPTAHTARNRGLPLSKVVMPLTRNKGRSWENCEYGSPMIALPSILARMAANLKMHRDHEFPLDTMRRPRWSWKRPPQDPTVSTSHCKARRRPETNSLHKSRPDQPRHPFVKNRLSDKPSDRDLGRPRIGNPATSAKGTQRCVQHDA